MWSHPYPLIKSINNAKLENDCVKIKLRSDPMSEKLDPYEFKMSLFDNNDPKEFLLFLQNFQMTLESSGDISASAKIQYLHTLLRGKVLHQLDTFSVEMVSTTTTHLNYIIFGFRYVIFSY